MERLDRRTTARRLCHRMAEAQPSVRVRRGCAGRVRRQSAAVRHPSNPKCECGGGTFSPQSRTVYPQNRCAGRAESRPQCAPEADYRAAVREVLNTRDHSRIEKSRSRRPAHALTKSPNCFCKWQPGSGRFSRVNPFCSRGTNRVTRNGRPAALREGWRPDEAFATRPGSRQFGPRRHGGISAAPWPVGPPRA